MDINTSFKALEQARRNLEINLTTTSCMRLVDEMVGMQDGSIDKLRNCLNMVIQKAYASTDDEIIRMFDENDYIDNMLSPELREERTMKYIPFMSQFKKRLDLGKDPNFKLEPIDLKRPINLRGLNESDLALLAERYRSDKKTL